MKRIPRIAIVVIVALGMVAGASGIVAAGGSGDKSDKKKKAKSGGGSDKVTICHVPPGNPGNPQTITISENAVDAHLDNHPGDSVGECDGEKKHKKHKKTKKHKKK